MQRSVIVNFKLHEGSFPALAVVVSASSVSNQLMMFPLLSPGQVHGDGRAAAQLRLVPAEDPPAPEAVATGGSVQAEVQPTQGPGMELPFDRPYALFAFVDSNSKLFHHQPAATTSTANGSAGGGDMAEVKKEATKVTRKLNEITEKLESLDTQLRLAMFGGAALLASNMLLLILFLFFG